MFVKRDTNIHTLKHTTMITLITLLISLLGYGSPADYSTLTQAELNSEIELAQANRDGGHGTDWELPRGQTSGE